MSTTTGGNRDAGRTAVKICGVRTAAQARAVAAAGAEMVGLVLAQSKRRVTEVEAAAVTAADYVRRPRFVGVFVEPELHEVHALVARIGLDLVQLSGAESPAFCAGLRVPYGKVIHVGEGEEADVGALVRRAAEYTGAAFIVLDTAGLPGTITRWGGTGVPVDWRLAAEVARHLDRPLMLAGGLRPETVAAAIRAVRPWGVDVSSGVETDGTKDNAKIAAFVAAARLAHESAEEIV